MFPRLQKLLRTIRSGESVQWLGDGNVQWNVGGLELWKLCGHCFSRGLVVKPTLQQYASWETCSRPTTTSLPGDVIAKERKIPG